MKITVKLTEEEIDLLLINLRDKHPVISPIRAAKDRLVEYKRLTDEQSNLLQEIEPHEIELKKLNKQLEEIDLTLDAWQW